MSPEDEVAIEALLNEIGFERAKFYSPWRAERVRWNLSATGGRLTIDAKAARDAHAQHRKLLAAMADVLRGLESLTPKMITYVDLGSRTLEEISQSGCYVAPRSAMGSGQASRHEQGQQPGSGGSNQPASAARASVGIRHPGGVHLLGEPRGPFQSLLWVVLPSYGPASTLWGLLLG